MSLLEHPYLPHAAAVLAALSVASLLWALSARAVARRTLLDRRLARAVGSGAGPVERLTAEQQARREAKAIRRRKLEESRATWRDAFLAAGLDWSLGRVASAYALLAATVAALAFVAGFSPAASLLLGAGGAPLVGVLALRGIRLRRRRLMEKAFPGALDIIVRGVKSGLPLNDCIDVAARETPEPLRSEFATMMDQQRHGVPIAEAVLQFARRVPLSEANFFAIVVGLQTKTGGRLAESLDNLVGVLRARTQIRAKIKSMSSEAKASGAIIAALPPVVSVLVYLTSPDYIGLLFDELIGNVVLIGSAVWMTIGVFVMSKMIAFDY
ncbi:MAG: type II secretion system F family protein [Pseudomonadota bacterium]